MTFYIMQIITIYYIITIIINLIVNKYLTIVFLNLDSIIIIKLNNQNNASYYIWYIY